MDEIKLQQILNEHPDCVTNGAKLKAILLDVYPDISRAIANTLAIMANFDIIKEIVVGESITEIDKSRYKKKLEDNYGLKEKIIDNCLNLLDSCIGCSKTNASNRVMTVSLTENTDSTKSTHTTIKQAPHPNYEAMATTASPKPTSKFITVGSIIKFGSYWQSKSQSEGKTPIEWRVLAINNNKALLISEYALDCKPYSSVLLNTPWETSTIKTWLNTYFLKEAFTPEEQVQIMLGPFLLDSDKANKYFYDNSKRQCVPTEYANSNGSLTMNHNTLINGKTACYWWLRSHANEQGSVAYVTDSGAIVPYARRFDCLNIGIRPSFWLQVDATKIQQETPLQKSGKPLIYCTVTYLDSISYFNGNAKQYYYISDDPTIKVGDYAIVLVGNNNEVKKVVIKKVACYYDNYPFPPEKTKHIYKKL